MPDDKATVHYKTNEGNTYSPTDLPSHETVEQIEFNYRCPYCDHPTTNNYHTPVDPK